MDVSGHIRDKMKLDCRTRSSQYQRIYSNVHQLSRSIRIRKLLFPKLLFLMIGLISLNSSLFRRRSFSDTCGARTFFHVQNSVDDCIRTVCDLFVKVSQCSSAHRSRLFAICSRTTNQPDNCSHWRLFLRWMEIFEDDATSATC